MQWPTLIVLAVVCVATFTDLRSRRIPNWLVLPFFVVGVAVSCFLHGWHGLGHSLGGAGLGLLLYGILFFMGGMGAGDVKLCAAIGAWIGPRQLIYRPGIHRFGGGSDGIGLGGVGRVPEGAFSAHRRLAFGSKERGEAVLTNPLRRKMPYAPAIAIGTFISFFAH